MPQQDRQAGPQDQQAEAFRLEAGQKPPGLLREFWEFLKHNKKWWLLPILVMILVMGLLVVLSGSGVGGLMYPIF